MVARAQLILRQHVVPEQPAVVHHPRDQAHVVLARGAEAQLARPRLHRVEDDHRPVDRLAEALEARDQVEGEAVGRPGRHPEQAREAVGPQRLEPIPHGGRSEARVVGVVQKQQVERVDAAALEAALGGHAQIVRVLALGTQRPVRETREAARPVALTLVEVVTERAHEEVVVTRQAAQRLTDQPVSLALAVHVGGEHRLDSVAWTQERGQSLVVERLAEVHEAPAAPAADGYVTGSIHRLPNLRQAGKRATRARGAGARAARRTRGAAG